MDDKEAVKNLFFVLSKLDKIDKAVDRQASTSLGRNVAVRKILREDGLYALLEEYRKYYKEVTRKDNDDTS